MTSRPRVYARIRPQNENERSQAGVIAFHSDCQDIEGRGKDVLVFEKDPPNDINKTRFDFVFDTTATQQDVFHHIKDEIISTLFSGYNASIFAYGQTSGGKTYTMEGIPQVKNGDGLTPRLIDAIFEKFNNNSDITGAKLECSYVQIYQEKIQDLFCNGKPLEIHMDRTGQYIAQGAAWLTLTDLTQTLDLYREASKMRYTSSTDLNLFSSRSHTILMLRLLWDETRLPGCRAQLNLIDLAGSEKLYQSNAAGVVMQEAIHINKSLSALGNVVTRLVDQAKYKNRRIHVPYKDSKLTYLLQSSLGGSNLVHFILCLSSSSLWKHESHSTIEFGKRALQLVIRPVRNPIDYKRLHEMEAMIEKMRNHIRSLEEELRTKPSPVEQDTVAPFLSLQHLAQVGDDISGEIRIRRRQRSENKNIAKLKRIITNLPETFEDLNSHCVLFPESKAEFRKLGGIEKIVGFILNCHSTFHKAHAAHTLSSVVDEEGKIVFGDVGGIESLYKLMEINEERCKEAACISLEAVCRNCNENKGRLTDKMFELLVSIMYQNKNQQVQEAACSCMATIVDNYPAAKSFLVSLGIVSKLLKTIENAPSEVVHVTKAATTCVGRIAQGDPDIQCAISKEDGVNMLIDTVLFSTVTERDHQVSMLASYALVNICCSNEDNMAVVRKHPRAEQVCYRLMEGLARAFGANTVREGFGRATAQEISTSFPYWGITVTDKWDSLNCGGRPIFSTFMENPQYYLYITKDTKLTLVIQDTLYEARIAKKQKTCTVYMGLAIFESTPELEKMGLKQVDFHGKLLEIAKYTSNCENVLNCTLKKSEIPYIVVPFTSVRQRYTNFALSAFADQPIELTPLSETTGWVRTVVEGCWTSFSGRGMEGFDWRANPQIVIESKEDCNIVCILTYKSLDEYRCMKNEENDEDIVNTRPRLQCRLFHSSFAPEKRYVKAICPIPQESSFIAANNYCSNSYVTTSAQLNAGETYVCIPYTEQPFEDTWRLRILADNDVVRVIPVAEREQEWKVTSITGTWANKPVFVNFILTGKFTVIFDSEQTYVRLSLLNSDGTTLKDIDSFWNCEANIEYLTDNEKMEGKSFSIVAEGIVKSGDTQHAASGNEFTFYIFSEVEPKITKMSFLKKENPDKSVKLPTDGTSRDFLTPPLVRGDDMPDGLAIPNDGNRSSEILDADGVVNSCPDSDTEDEKMVHSAVREATKIYQMELEKIQIEKEKLEKELVMQGEVIANLQLQAASANDALKAANKKNGGGGCGGGIPRGSAAEAVKRIRSQNGSILGGSRRGTSSVRLDSFQKGSEITIDKVIDQLSNLTNKEKIPSLTEWQTIRKNLKECHAMLASLQE